MKTGILAPLKMKDFRKLFIAQSLSELGNWLDLLVITALIVYDWNLGPTAVAAEIIAFGIPWVIIGPIAGVWINRWNLKNLMLICTFLRIGVVFLLLFAPNLPVLLILVFIKSTLGALFDPARQIATRAIVPKEQLGEAVALSQFAVTMTKIIGPALGGAILALWGTRSPFIVEMIVFSLAFICLLTFKDIKHEQHIAEKKAEPFKKVFLDGLSYIYTKKVLFLAILIMGINMFLIFLYDGLLSISSKSIGFNKSMYGVILGVIGVGSVIGTVSLIKWNNWKQKPLLTMILTAFLSGLLIILIGLGSNGMIHLNQVSWFIVFAGLGIVSAAFTLPYGYVLQNETPVDLMGRVSSVSNAIQTSSMLSAPAIGAGFAEIYGVGWVLFISGLITLLFSTISYVVVIRHHQDLQTDQKIAI